MKHRQRRPPRGNGEQVVWAVVIMIVVAVSLLYCAGLAGTIARSVLLATPRSVEIPPLDLTDQDLFPFELPASTSTGPSMTPSAVATSAATLTP